MKKRFADLFVNTMYHTCILLLCLLAFTAVVFVMRMLLPSFIPGLPIGQCIPILAVFIVVFGPTPLKNRKGSQ